jgi:hypothetical protein
MLFQRVVLALLSLYAGLAWSVCPPHEFSAPSQVRLAGAAVMVVVHATSTHDARFSAKRGVDEAVRFARDKGMPVIYLQDDTPDRYYYMEDCRPDHWVFSGGGEISFAVAPTQIYIVGGHLEMCMSVALHDILLQWARMLARDRSITYFMDAIYSNGKEIDPSDAFYGDFIRFLDVVTYGRPGGEHWPKLSLLETMGVVIRQDHQFEYLRQILPRWQATLPDTYRVELQMNDLPRKVLRAAEGRSAPTLLFRFLDSALSLSDPLLRNP